MKIKTKALSIRLLGKAFKFIVMDRIDREILKRYLKSKEYEVELLSTENKTMPFFYKGLWIAVCIRNRQIHYEFYKSPLYLSIFSVKYKFLEKHDFVYSHVERNIDTRLQIIESIKDVLLNNRINFIDSNGNSIRFACGLCAYEIKIEDFYGKKIKETIEAILLININLSVSRDLPF